MSRRKRPYKSPNKSPYKARNKDDAPRKAEEQPAALPHYGRRESHAFKLT